MKLATALKLKNKLAGEVAQLKEVLTKQNVHQSRQPFDYDNTQVLANIRAKISELVKVKAAIAAANAEIYDRIFLAAELKGLINTLKGLDTRQGIVTTGTDYGRPFEVEYTAQIRKADVDLHVASLESEIHAIQDSLDEFNFTRSVSVEPAARSVP